MLFSLIPTDIEDHQLMYERSVLARWTILGYELSILEARGQMDTEDGMCLIKCSASRISLLPMLLLEIPAILHLYLLNYFFPNKKKKKR